MTILNRAMRFVMADLNIGNKELSEITGIHASIISRYKTGRQKVSFDTAVLIAEKIGMKPSEFVAMGEK